MINEKFILVIIKGKVVATLSNDTSKHCFESKFNTINKACKGCNNCLLQQTLSYGIKMIPGIPSEEVIQVTKDINNKGLDRWLRSYFSTQ